MEFKALRVADLTEEVAENLETTLDVLVGVERFTIRLETQELAIVFDEHQLSFRRISYCIRRASAKFPHANSRNGESWLSPATD
jgi:hypothetical protein